MGGASYLRRRPRDGLLSQVLAFFIEVASSQICPQASGEHESSLSVLSRAQKDSVYPVTKSVLKRLQKYDMWVERQRDAVEKHFFNLKMYISPHLMSARKLSSGILWHVLRGYEGIWLFIKRQAYKS